MSGIVGIWNLDGRPVEEALLAAMSATLAHRGPDGEGVWVQGSAGFACRLFRTTPEAAAETQPLVHPSGASLVFDGRLDNREEVLASLPPSPGITRRSPDPNLVLAAYRAFGARFPGRLAGDFALGLLDLRDQRLLLARDAIGVRPLYYACAGETFLFASEIKALLAHPLVSPRPNDDLLARFLLHGLAEGHGATFFQGILSLPPAHLAIVTPAGVALRRYWDFDACPPILCATVEEYVAAFRERFERAVRRRLRSAHPVAVSVSGGLDSSAIFCLAHTVARGAPGRFPRVLGVSYVSPGGTASDEVAFLREIEREYGVAVDRLPAGAAGPLRGSREAVRHIEAPFLDEQWETTHAFFSRVRDLGARVILTGHWADQLLFDQAYLVDLVRRLAWRGAYRHLAEYPRWFTGTPARIFAHRFVLDLLKYALPHPLVQMLQRLRAQPHRPWYGERLRGWGGRRPPALLPDAPPLTSAHGRALYEQARSSHHVQCMEWDNKVAAMHGLEIAFPFLDRDLLAFLMAIPGEVQTWRGVPKALLRAALRGVLPEAIAGRRWKADFSRLVNEGMAQDFPQLAHALLEGSLAIQRGYVRASGLRRALGRLQEGLREPDCDSAWMLSDLLGLEVWLQMFLGTQADDEPAPSLHRLAPVAPAGGTP